MGLPSLSIGSACSHPKDFLLRPKGRPGLITEGKVDLKQLPFLFGSWPKIDGNPVLPGGPDALYVKVICSV